MHRVVLVLVTLVLGVISATMDASLPRQGRKKQHPRRPV